MAARINELKQARIEAKKALDALLDAHLSAAQKEARGFTDDEKTAQIAAERKVTGIDELIAAEQRRLDLEIADLETPEKVAERTAKEPKDPRKFASLGEQLMAVKTAGQGGRRDPRLGFMAGPAGASDAVASDGGFLVQQEWGGVLAQKTWETGVLIKDVTRMPIGEAANGLRLRLLDETSRVNGSRYGGIQAFWAAEADAATASKPKFRGLELRLQKLIGLMYVTDELLEDAVALQAYVNEWFPLEFGFKIDDAILNGTGAGQPLGILNGPALISIAKIGGQAAKTILAQNVEQMYTQMLPFSLANAKWYINQEIWPQLFTLFHPIGTGGVPVFIPGGGLGNGLEQAPFGTIFGRPVQPIEQAPALGSVGDILFADLSRYLLIDKGGLEFAASVHVKFLTDETAFRWVIRLDGQPILNGAYTPFKGAITLSPYVALAAR